MALVEAVTQNVDGRLDECSSRTQIRTKVSPSKRRQRNRCSSPAFAFVYLPTLVSTNATAIWTALAAGEVPPAVEALPEPGAILVWRQDQVSRFRAIDQIEQQALLAARSGLSFADLCAAMVAAHGQEDGIARAGQLLGQWLADGLITAVEERHLSL